MVKLGVIVTLALCWSTALYGQETMPKTNTTDIHAKVNKDKVRPEKKRHYMTIIKPNTKGMLYGNKCFEDYTLSKGYHYDIQTKGKQGSMSGFSRFWHNVGVNVALIFTKGPWWKLSANKKMKECRKLSGDFVG